ncbi:MAG TPA: hypothetical protein PK620_17185 [Denitromonas sp.]|nr:hypothetical protein [Rhodocyclaceae bacterium]HPR05924.1 hypothetical protein [Denitromonas sp.]HQU89995.1 hypothetical protein [Denitromonas sp.]HQV16643.1 hypothetical protein [Denitromonas sp.]
MIESGGGAKAAFYLLADALAAQRLACQARSLHDVESVFEPAEVPLP